jgi:hypothetical protein
VSGLAKRSAHCQSKEVGVLASVARPQANSDPEPGVISYPMTCRRLLPRALYGAVVNGGSGNKVNEK